VATLKANFFVGYNLGNSFFKLGFVCLIGIAHLPESMAALKFSQRFEFRPSFSTDISDLVNDDLIKKIPLQGHKVVKNLLCAIKTVASHILSRVPISGNIRYEDESPLYPH
jgi:hypothetical protein